MCYDKMNKIINKTSDSGTVNVMKIATHNSATGEKSGGLTWLLVPFARCQTKTLKEQYDAGCRLFDIRLKKVGNTWRMGHGLWYTERDAEDMLGEIDSFAWEISDALYITVTLEDRNVDRNDAIGFIEHVKKQYNFIKWGPVYLKHGKNGKYELLLEKDSDYCNIKTEQSYKVLDGRSWHTYLPIPWLWKKLYFNKPEFNEHTYKYVDFL